VHAACSTTDLSLPALLCVSVICDWKPAALPVLSIAPLVRVTSERIEGTITKPGTLVSCLAFLSSAGRCLQAKAASSPGLSSNDRDLTCASLASVYSSVTSAALQRCLVADASASSTYSDAFASLWGFEGGQRSRGGLDAVVMVKNLPVYFSTDAL